jgi:hypothetical protein
VLTKSRSGSPESQRRWIADHRWREVGQSFLDPVPDSKYRGFTIAK